VVLAAVAGALVVRSALLHALGSPLGAGEVWESKGVFGDVRLLVVGADTPVGQGFLFPVLVKVSHIWPSTGSSTYRITGVGNGLARGCLCANDGASANLGIAPVSWVLLVRGYSHSYKAEDLLLVLMGTVLGSMT
jgi:hypothetical protein